LLDGLKPKHGIFEPLPGDASSKRKQQQQLQPKTLSKKDCPRSKLPFWWLASRASAA
jgi:hypothetical protein